MKNLVMIRVVVTFLVLLIFVQFSVIDVFAASNTVAFHEVQIANQIKSRNAANSLVDQTHKVDDAKAMAFPRTGFDSQDQLAYANSGLDYQIKVLGLLDTAIKYNGRDTYTVAFQVKTSNDKKATYAQTLAFAYDMTIFDVATVNANNIFPASSISDIDWTNLPMTSSTRFAMPYEDWTASLRVRRSQSGTTGFLYMEPGREPDYFWDGMSLPSFESLQTIRLAFKDGKSFSDMISTSIRLMSIGELVLTNLHSQISISDGGEIAFTYGLASGNLGSLPEPLIDLQVPVKDPVGETTVSIIGSIKSSNPKKETTVQLIQDDKVKYTSIIPENNSTEQVEQTFIFELVEAGRYTLVITKTAHTILKINNIIVSDLDLDLRQDNRDAVKCLTLLCGDINGDRMINDGDLTELWKASNYNRRVGDLGVDERCDLNGDGLINDKDLTILWLIGNYNKGTVVIDYPIK